MSTTPRHTPHEGDKCGKNNRAGLPCKNPAGWGTPHVGAGRCRKQGGNSPGGLVQGGRLLAERAAQSFGLPVDIDPTTALLDEVKNTAGVVAWLYEQVRNLTPESITWGKTRTVSAAAGQDTGQDEGQKDETEGAEQRYLNQIDGLAELTRKQLQDEARSLGLHIAGSKSDLSDRIQEHLHRQLQTDLASAAPAPLTAERVEHGARVHPMVELWQRERTHLRKLCEAAIRAGVEERRVRLAEKDGARVVAVIRGILDDLHLTAEQLAKVPHVVPARLRSLLEEAA